MRTFSTAIISILALAMPILVHGQDCDLVQEQACCYTSNGSGSDITYCCNGSVVGNSDSSGSAALNSLICCQGDGRINIQVGFDITTCRAGTPTPLTAKGIAASTVAAVIQSLSASRSASRESLYSSASASRASAATSATRSTSTGTALASSRTTSPSTASSTAAGSTVSSLSSSAAAGSASSARSTGAASLMNMNAWNAALAGGIVFAAAAL